VARKQLASPANRGAGSMVNMGLLRYPHVTACRTRRCLPPRFGPPGGLGDASSGAGVSPASADVRALLHFRGWELHDRDRSLYGPIVPLELVCLHALPLALAHAVVFAKQVRLYAELKRLRAGHVHDKLPEL
jgi:hypothetical protein